MIQSTIFCMQNTQKPGYSLAFTFKMIVAKLPATPQPSPSSISLSQSSLQVGPGVRFTDDTQKQDSLLHFVKINDSLSWSSEILNLGISADTY